MSAYLKLWRYLCCNAVTATNAVTAAPLFVATATSAATAAFTTAALSDATVLLLLLL